MQRKWWTLLAVSVATFMLLLDITVVNTALPAIQEDLNASFTELQWVIDAYTLALASCSRPARWPIGSGAGACLLLASGSSRWPRWPPVWLLIPPS